MPNIPSLSILSNHNLIATLASLHIYYMTSWPSISPLITMRTPTLCLTLHATHQALYMRQVLSPPNNATHSIFNTFFNISRHFRRLISRPFFPPSPQLKDTKKGGHSHPTNKPPHINQPHPLKPSKTTYIKHFRPQTAQPTTTKKRPLKAPFVSLL